jgi:hypothetical protein
MRVSRTTDAGVRFSDFLNERAPRKNTWVSRMIWSSTFHLVVAVVIVVNTVVMAVEDQYIGWDIGYDLKTYTSTGHDAFGLYADLVFHGLEIFFAVFFTVEAALRMLGRGVAYWKDPVELLDLLVVVSSNAALVISSTSFDFALLRLLRAAKLLRIVKLITRLGNFATSLHLLTTSLRASLNALAWVLLLLLMIQTLVTLVTTYLIRVLYLSDDSALDDDAKTKLFEYFGTYLRAMLSMFELSLANWPVICRFMVDELHEAWMPLVVLYKLVFGFAVVGIINGVFIQETFQVASTDDAIMVKRKVRSEQAHEKKMTRLLKHADRDGDGVLDFTELRRVLSHKAIRDWLASMELDASDADLIWSLVDREDEDYMTLKELVSGLGKLKGPARQIDMQRVVRSIQSSSFEPSRRRSSARGM